MQTNKKTSDQAFDMAKSIQDVSRSGTLYGKLFMLKEMQIYLLKQEKMLEEEIKKGESNE